MRSLSRHASLALAAALGACLAIGGTAQADPVRCSRTINKEYNTFLKNVSKALDKCKISVVTKGVPATLGDCPDAGASAKIARATSKLKSKIERTCGGRNRTCSAFDTGTAVDVPLADINWNIGECMNFEAGSFADCSMPINDCSDIGECLTCIGSAAVDQGVARLIYDGFNPMQFFANSGNVTRTQRRCQQSIARESLKFFQRKQKILSKCWDSKLAGKAGYVDGQPCPDTDPNTGNTGPLAKIRALELKKIDNICKRCGGGGDRNRDGLCDEVNAPVNGLNLSLGDIVSLPFSCPLASLPPSALHPGGLDCGAIGSPPPEITTLQEYIDCIDCIYEFKAECASRAAVGDGNPGLGIAYPSECNSCVLDSTGDPCPSTIQITGIGAAADLDTGWTGLSHDFDVPSNGRITLTVSNCDGTNRPTCGECDLAGPIPNGGGEPFNNQRCGGNDNHVQCTTDQDCIDAGASTPCSFYFAPPLPLSSGGVPVCVTNEIVGAVSGTLNIETGEGTTPFVKLISRVHVGLTVARPCPNCENGTCTGGPRVGQPCTVSGTSTIFGDLSYDCPPSAGGNIGTLRLTLPFSTGAQARTLSAASPICRAVGFSNQRCMCDTCATAEGEACATNADCSGVCDMGTCAGGPLDGQSCVVTADCERVCGGRRCQGGPSNGNPCVVNADCSPGTCGVPGLATAPNQCDDATCTPTPGDTDSVNEGECAAGPNDGLCSIERFRGCLANADCQLPPAGNCSDCLPNQTCNFGARQCFTDNGQIGNSVSVAGAADPGCGNNSKPTIGTLFCIPPTAEGAVNATAGLPSLGRLTLPSVVRFDP
jgi:hypothetical protein